MHQNTPVQASYRFDTTSNSNGAYQIPYIEGRYELEVWPNVTSRWARAVFQSSSIMQNQMDITLEAKPDLRGRAASKTNKADAKRWSQARRSVRCGSGHFLQPTRRLCHIRNIGSFAVSNAAIWKTVALNFCLIPDSTI